MPGKSTLAPLAGLAMAVLAATCLVTFSLVAGNTVRRQTTGGSAARPQSPPGGGDGAVTVPLPPAGGGPGASPANPIETSTPTGAAPEAESVAPVALADFFGGVPPETTTVARLPELGAPPPDIRPERPSSPTGAGEDDCPGSRAELEGRSGSRSQAGPPACDNPQEEPPGLASKNPPKDNGPPTGGYVGGPGENGNNGNGPSPKPAKKDHEEPTPAAAPPGKSGGSGQEGHPHGGPPGHDDSGGEAGRSGNPHGTPPGQTKDKGGHPHGEPPGQSKK